MKWKKGRCIPLIVVLLLHPVLSFAAYETNNGNASTWLSGQQNADGSWGASPTEKFLYTVEAVQALRAVGQRNAAYFRGITWLENHAADNADYSARRVLALAAHGDDVTDEVLSLTNVQNVGVAGRDAWGLSATYLQSPLDTALVLNSLAALGTSANVQAAINYLKATQLGSTDQGWPLARESVSDPYTTAMVLRTLAPLTAVDPTLATPIANGLGTLRTTIDATSPVYLQALAAQAAWLAGDTMTAQTWLTFLASSQAGDGSWSTRIYDTALAMRALATADGTDSATKQFSILIPDKNLRTAINTALGRNAMDSLDRSEMLRLTSLTAAGLNINNLTGLESALNLQSADLRNNNIISTTPIDRLPRLATILLDGNPSVLASDVNEDVPTLPEWGLIIMAVLLLSSAVRQQYFVYQAPRHA